MAFDPLYKFYVLKYNNYNNRKIKKEKSLQDYLSYPNDCNNINGFQFGDGVITTQTFNFTDVDNEEYNYAILTDMSNNIISRWFIIESDYSTKGQSNLTLKRDSIVDYFDSFINSQGYIEKGYVRNDNPLSVITEPVQVNQIKQSETLLKQSSIGWYAVYYKNDIEDSKLGTKTYQFGNNYTVDYTISELSSLVGIDEVLLTRLITKSTPIYYVKDYDDVIKLRYKSGKANTTAANYYTYNTNYLKISNHSQTNYIAERIWLANQRYEMLFFDNVKEYSDPSWLNKMESFGTNFVVKQAFNDLVSYILNDGIYNIVTESQINTLITYNGKIIDVNGTSYRLDTMTIPGSDIILNKSLNEYDNNVSGLRLAITQSLGNGNIEIQSGNELEIKIYRGACTSNSEIAYSSNIKFELKRNPMKGEPYSLMILPAGPLKINAYNPFDYANEISLAIISYLMGNNNNSDAWSDYILDVQLLPYFPMSMFVGPNGEIRTQTTEGVQFPIYCMESVKDATTDVTLSYIFYPNTNKFECSINKPITPKFSSLKEEVNLNFCRLVSPNFQSKFDFNLGLNGGICDGFIARCTYKPYQPVIYVQPRFSFMYGQNFDDDRGLICSGDFSLSQSNDAWANYQNNNKLYDKIFNRDIQNLQFNQNQERIQAGANMFTGSITGGATGAATGAITGGGLFGALAGGIVGGVASVTGGAVDLSLMGARHQEALSYMKDKFDLSLASIKAQPDIITKISAMDINFKIFPLLEYYSCTDKELELFRNKMILEGYTLNATDLVGNYVYTEEHYIKGRLIRIDEELDNHITTDIDNEFNKGLYIKGE